MSKISEGWCRFANVAARDVVVPGPNVMALLTVSTESALMEAGNSVLMTGIFHGLVAIWLLIIGSYISNFVPLLAVIIPDALYPLAKGAL